ncbi:plakophilin-3a isoform X2 [Melanotaenia boesemani]|uniref:plakophilin-3a isoform X2 n=1 Tax=Melanotaenia boesemani TaxID=1250792 RepID=UPI001C03D102|nr:plakophilin-3a isoform X2 [Melanotaenia boesemani]
MSVIASESVFLTALQPNSSVTTYALPSDIQLGNGSDVLDEVARARRVQQQVQMRLAEKSTLPRQNGSASQHAMSDYGGSSTVKYSTYSPNFSSKSSYMYTGSRTMGPRVSQRTDFSCRSAAPDLAQFQRMSVGGGIAGGGNSGFYQEEMRMGGYQGPVRQQSRMEQDVISVHSLRNLPAVNSWIGDTSDAGSLVSDRDATYTHQYAQSAVNGYSGQIRQGSGTLTYQAPMQRSLSGTLYRGGGMTGGGTEIIQQQPSFKGPAHRTINRITNRNRMSIGSLSGNQVSSSASSFGGGGDRVDKGFMVSTMSSGSQGNLMMQRPGTLSRAASIKSMHSVGKGMDVFGQMGMGLSMSNLSGFATLDMATAVQHLRNPDPDLQVLGAAYIQHQCYNENEAKNEVRNLNGIGDLVKLFNSDNQEVQRYVTGATRNLIYENMDNKKVLIEEGGIPELVRALNENDDELRKNITGILWNLSSKDTLKEKLAKETLFALTEKILVPLAATEKENAERITECSEIITESPSQSEIFCNTTGCLRNLSSVSEKTRHQMRETSGLVPSLVDYIKASLDKNKAEEKGVENAVCVLRNLSYQLYSELPQSVAIRLEGPTRDQHTGNGDTIGCFTPQSKKAKNKKNQAAFTFSEVTKDPKGMEWLWHPQIMGMYHRVLKSCEINATTREAASGALQNITAGDKRWASVLSSWALEQERMLPTLLDLMNTNRDVELRSLTGFMRNLSRHAVNKDDMATKSVSHLVEKLPEDGQQKEPSSEVVVNICGILNNLVTGSSLAARDITFFNGLPNLMGIKNTHDSSPGKIKASKAASTVLTNMFHYKKLHKQYKTKGYTRADFADILV